MKLKTLQIIASRLADDIRLESTSGMMSSMCESLVECATISEKEGFISVEMKWGDRTYTSVYDVQGVWKAFGVRHDPPAMIGTQGERDAYASGSKGGV